LLFSVLELSVQRHWRSQWDSLRLLPQRQSKSLDAFRVTVPNKSPGLFPALRCRQRPLHPRLAVAAAAEAAAEVGEPEQVLQPGLLEARRQLLEPRAERQPELQGEVKEAAAPMVLGAEAAVAAEVAAPQRPPFPPRPCRLWTCS